jgi:hypothetical protein
VGTDRIVGWRLGCVQKDEVDMQSTSVVMRINFYKFNKVPDFEFVNQNGNR